MFLPLSLCSYCLKRSKHKTDSWGIDGLTEEGVRELLDIGWTFKANPNSENGEMLLQVFNKGPAGYRDDDSMLIGGVREPRFLPGSDFGGQGTMKTASSTTPSSRDDGQRTFGGFVTSDSEMSSQVNSSQQGYGSSVDWGSGAESGPVGSSALGSSALGGSASEATSGASGGGGRGRKPKKRNGKAQKRRKRKPPQDGTDANSPTQSRNRSRSRPRRKKKAGGTTTKAKKKATTNGRSSTKRRSSESTTTTNDV